METNRRNLIVASAALASGGAVLGSAAIAAQPEPVATSTPAVQATSLVPRNKYEWSAFFDLITNGHQKHVRTGDDYLLEVSYPDPEGDLVFKTVADAEQYMVENLQVDRPIRLIKRQKGFIPEEVSTSRISSEVFRLTSIGRERLRDAIISKTAEGFAVLNNKQFTADQVMLLSTSKSNAVPNGEVALFYRKPRLVLNYKTEEWHLNSNELDSPHGIRLPFTLITERV